MLKCNRTYLFFIFVTCMVVLAATPATGDTVQQNQNISLLKSQLSSRLDSLEVEKQFVQRSGGSLEEIESEISNIKDSIGILRINYSKQSAPLPKYFNVKIEETQQMPLFLSELFHPKSFFDWVLLGTGVTALISGIAFFGSLLYSLYRFLNKKNKTTHIPEPHPARQPAIRILNMNRTTEEIPKINKMFKKEPAPHAGMVNKETSTQKPNLNNKESLHLLKQRMKIEPKENPTHQSQEVQDTPQAPMPPLKKDFPVTHIKNRTIRDDILEAAEKGMSAKDIARTFKVSIDQVKLILHLTHKD